MTTPRSVARLLKLALSLVTLGAAPVRAQDTDEMLKWLSATVVHYRIVGEFAGEASLMGSPKPDSRYGSVTAKVTDRVEMDFDWDPTGLKFVGTPVIKNFATKIGEFVVDKRCPAPKIPAAQRAFELATVSLRLEDAGPMLLLKRTTKTDFIGGEVPYMVEDNCGHWNTHAASSETSTTNWNLPVPMMMGMRGQAPGLKFTPDGKSIVEDLESWTWTYTISIVK